MILATYMRQLQLEDYFSVLSTLGGAMSSLGNYSVDFVSIFKFIINHCWLVKKIVFIFAFSLQAIKTRKISLVQLKVALKSQNMYNVARCYVYIAYSLIQMNQLKSARRFMKHHLKSFIETNFTKERNNARYQILRNMYICASFDYKEKLKTVKTNANQKLPNQSHCFSVLF